VTPVQVNHAHGWMVWGERVLLVALILLFAARGFIPAWRHLNTDFPNYYLCARLYRQGYPIERVYEWTWFQRQRDRLEIEQRLVGFIPLTLPSMLPVMPWCSLPPLQAKHFWLLTNVVFLLATGFFLKASTNLNLQRVGFLTLLAVVPLRDSFRFGQMHVFVLLLLTFAAWLYFKDSGFFSGLVLAIAAAIKIYPALFLIFFLFKKQWRAATGLIVGLSGAGLMSLYLFGRDACRLYALQVLPRALRGEVTDPYNVAWNTFTALLRRLFIAEPELNPTPVAHLPWLYALLQPLVHGFIFVVFMWAISAKKPEGDRAKIEWAAYLFLLLFLSSQAGSYHFVVLILTAVLVTDYLITHQQRILAAFAVLLYALICGPLIHLPHVSPTGWQNLLFFWRLGFMTLFAGVLLWMLVPRPAEWRAHFNFRSLIVPASAVLVLVVVGFISTQNHLAGQFENYKARVATTPDDLLASDPVVTSNSVLFTAMTREGYAIRRLQAGSIVDLPTLGSDWFHPTASEPPDSVWAEQSSQDGSRVVRFSTDAPEGNTASWKVEADNAQEPVVSRDGQLLAFLRPVHGRNGLWVRKITAATEEPDGAGPTEIAGAEYDVREASFAPDHRLIFSSKRTGRFALYVATLSGDVQQMTAPTCSARYPAMSPDGRWVAFSCEQRGSWQLHAMDLQGNQELQLSTGDCNSVSPAWTTDSKRVIYATDCGRGLGLTALAEITVFP
jgi:Glycosyltransferase family 87/WD40-like Beta Propeller Repeat